MASIQSHKALILKSELDIFSTKETQTSVESGSYVELRPISILDLDSPIEFLLSESDDYVDISHTKIKLRVKILNEDGTALAADSPVAPVNNFVSSLFEHVSIELNGKTITPPSNCYHYRSYIETLLNYSEDAKCTHLSSCLFVQDEAGKMDSVEGSGFVDRKARLSKGAFELSGYIHSELMNQDKYLLNNVGIRFKFYRSKANFALMTTAADKNNYRIDITDAILLCRKTKINTSIANAHERTLQRNNARYPINRIDLKAISIGQGIQSKCLDNIIIGEYSQKKIFFSSS